MLFCAKIQFMSGIISSFSWSLISPYLFLYDSTSSDVTLHSEAFLLYTIYALALVSLISCTYHACNQPRSTLHFCRLESTSHLIWVLNNTLYVTKSFVRLLNDTEHKNNKAKDHIVERKELERYHCNRTSHQNLNTWIPCGIYICWYEEKDGISNSNLACVSLSKV